MKKTAENALWILKIVVGAALFSLGFDLFLEPHAINAGGLSGLAQILVNWRGRGSVGFVVAMMNLPLFIFGGVRIGKRFFWGSLVGMAAMSLSLELFALIPAPETEPLLAALYGGVLGGIGLGIVFATGASTGGSDIICRLLKCKWRNVPIGTITMAFDALIMVLTGLVTGEPSHALYTGVAVFLSGKVIDLVVYSFDYSKVALIISANHEQISEMIQKKLDRGVTFLSGQGAYSGQEKKVILTAIKKYQLAELKELVAQLDKDAFVIVQEAHQVLGDGFSHYTRDSL